MTDLDTALRAADFHVPDAAKVIREHLEALRRGRAAFNARIDELNHNLKDMTQRAEQAERERDAFKSRSEWLLHNGGLLNEWAKEWRPDRNGTLIDFLRHRIDKQLRNAND